MKDKRNELAALPGNQKFFLTQRLVPQSFIPTKNEMIRQAKLKLAADWERLVLSQEGSSKKKWISSRDATWRHMNVRIQFKTNPRFSVWCEALDPSHRLCWKPVDLESDKSFFNGYDLGLAIPCPTTREKALSDPSYRKPRRPFKEEQSLECIPSRTPFVPRGEQNQAKADNGTLPGRKRHTQ